MPTIYPTRDWYIPGVPAVAQDVDEGTAAELLAYRPAAFTLVPPEVADELVAEPPVDQVDDGGPDILSDAPDPTSAPATPDAQPATTPEVDA
jgi:hypothetical protein